MTWSQIATQPWMLWRRQVAAILRLELKKSLFSKRAWWIYILTLGPVVITGLHSLFPGNGGHTIGEDNMIFAGIFQVYFLRLGIFFGCLGIFSNLFRAEVLERTLHYYFMSPVRREVLAFSKYLAGLVAAVTYFTGSVVLEFSVYIGALGSRLPAIPLSRTGPRPIRLVCRSPPRSPASAMDRYSCSRGIIFRNPLIPAAVVFVWENLNPFLPSLLKKFSVIFYLKSLCPAGDTVEGPLAILITTTNPTPAWLAIPGLLLVSALVLTYAATKSRSLEVTYSD